MDFDSRSPIYLQLAAAIKRKIVTGEWEKGNKIPSVRDLALSYGVNPNTMQRALAELENENLLYAERTSGRYVTKTGEVVKKALKEMVSEEIKYFIEAMSSLGVDRDKIVGLITDYREES